MKIIDCFIFYNELDLLTYRLNILDDIVDYFVIVESTHTFTGKEKQLYFNENKHKFERFNEKIIHIVVDDFPFRNPNGNEVWANEYFQRNAISRGLERIHNLDMDDIIIIADLDEIPAPKILSDIKTSNLTVSVNILQMDFITII